MKQETQPATVGISRLQAGEEVKRVSFCALGGTIAMSSAGGRVHPTLAGADLLAMVPGLDKANGATCEQIAATFRG
jgi:L-asparaginase/Glu-tRNA(Gln) amidotransferase subunit D